MAKTTFSSGTIVTSSWLNGAQEIFFDGQSLDWHYNPLGLNSLVRTGANGLDSAYVTLLTDQPTLSAAGLYQSGSAINGTKVITGVWNFGYDPLQAGNPVNIRDSAPRSYTTNDKYDYAGGLPSPTVSQKFNVLNSADIITKEVLQTWVEDLFDSLEIDNGIYESVTAPACNNYTGAGGSDVICGL